MDCGSCGEALTSDEVALTKKLLGRKVEAFFCKGCLAAFLGVEEEEMDRRIKEFRSQGCGLFG